MARAVRVEFEGAYYHAMARGDRGEAIVREDWITQRLHMGTRAACAALRPKLEDASPTMALCEGRSMRSREEQY